MRLFLLLLLSVQPAFAVKFLDCAGLVTGTLRDDIAHVIDSSSVETLLSLSTPGREGWPIKISSDEYFAAIAYIRLKILQNPEFTSTRRKQLFKKVIENKMPVPDNILDALLGIDLVGVSYKLSQTMLSQRDRFGAHPIWNGTKEMAQTSYQRFHEYFSQLSLQPGNLVVDIGTGFGRLGFYLAIFYPGVRFIGYELVPERSAESRHAAARLQLGDEIQFVEQDMSREDFHLPEADFYFSWCPVNSATGIRLWSQLKDIASRKDFTWVFQGLQGSTSAGHESWLVKSEIPNVYRTRR